MHRKHPQWAILGIDAGDRIEVWASKTLTYAEITTKVEQWRTTFKDHPCFRWTHEVSFVTHDFSVVTGPDYATALANLFAAWSPEPEKAAEIATARQIEP